MDFEDILLEVGDYGRYQKKLIFFYLLPTSIFLPWFAMNVFFMVSLPEHWCNVPDLVSSNLSIAQQRSLISPTDEHCKRYNISYKDLLDVDNYTVPENTTMVSCDQGWQYDRTYYDVTAASKWNMVCDDAHYSSFILTMNNVGSIIGTPIYGGLSDKYGRKIVFFIVLIVTTISGVASSLMTDFVAFVVMKTINGSVMPSVFQIPYIIILEIVAPEMRTRMNGMDNVAWTIGQSLLPLIAYLTRSWVILGLVSSAVSFLFFGYYPFLPESPRWLVSMERYDEAAEVLYDISIKNGKRIEKADLLHKLQKHGEHMKKEALSTDSAASCWDLLRYPQLRKKFLIITVCWMANFSAYYGLQLNTANLPGNEFINFFLTSTAELPGYLASWYVMNRWGRRWCSATGFMLTGLVCMLPAFDFAHADLISSIFGKFFAASTFIATYQQSSELYPTVVRSLGMGMSCTLAMIVCLAVPYLVYLSVYSKAIPFLVIGGGGILAGVLASFLPETLNENLPQTIADGENFGRNRKFFSVKRRRVSVCRERAASASLSMKVPELATIAEAETYDRSDTIDPENPGYQDGK